MIEFDAFAYCRGLEYIVIDHRAADSTLSISSDAFSGCEKLDTVLYKGTQEEFEQITDNSSGLTNATIYYYFSIQPTDNGNYWHYDTDGKTPVIWTKEEN